MSHGSKPEAWPDLPYAAWKETCATLHLWTQVVGKVRLARTPWLNHSWHVPLYVTARGLTTSPIPYGQRSFEIAFDLNRARARHHDQRRCPPQHGSGAADGRGLLRRGDVRAHGPRHPRSDQRAPLRDPGSGSVQPGPTHAAYDAEYAQRFWRVLLQADRVLKQFRTGFIGKCSPVHFFWGSFDLAVTRFSGRKAPPHPGGVPGLADAVMREAYSHEVSSAGFWPGGGGVDAPAFYSYAYPVAGGFKTLAVQPEAAFFSESSASFFCPTTPSGPRPIPTRRCSPSCRPPTRRRSEPGAGSAPRSSAHREVPASLAPAPERRATHLDPD